MKKNILKILSNPGVPGDTPEYEQNPYIQGGLMAPLGDPLFVHVVIE